MKTTVSIPDDLFVDAERLAKTLETSRSQLYSNALREYVARYAPDRVTAALNEVCVDMGDEENGFVPSASIRTLERSEW